MPASDLRRASWRMQASSGSPRDEIRSPVTTARCGRSSQGHVDHPRQLGLAQERAEVDVAELQDAQAVEIQRQAGQRHVHFAHAEIQALDQGSVTHDGERSGHQDVTGGVERAPAARVDVGAQLLPNGLERQVHRQNGGGGDEIGQDAGAQDQGDMPGDSQAGDQLRKTERISGQQHGVEKKDRAARGGARPSREEPPGRAQQYGRDAPLNGRKKRWLRLSSAPGPLRAPIPISYCNGLRDPGVDEHRDGRRGGRFRAQHLRTERNRLPARGGGKLPLGIGPAALGAGEQGGAAGAGPACRQQRRNNGGAVVSSRK